MLSANDYNDWFVFECARIIIFIRDLEDWDI